MKTSHISKIDPGGPGPTTFLLNEYEVFSVDIERCDDEFFEERKLEPMILFDILMRYSHYYVMIGMIVYMVILYENALDLVDVTYLMTSCSVLILLASFVIPLR